MSIGAGRTFVESEGRRMADKPASGHFVVVNVDSSLRFFSMTTMYPVFGKVAELVGSIDAAWNGDGTIAADPAPRCTSSSKLKICVPETNCRTTRCGN